MCIGLEDASTGLLVLEFPRTLGKTRNVGDLSSDLHLKKRKAHIFIIMEIKKVLIIAIVFVVITIGIGIKFSGNNDGELNDYEILEVEEEVVIQNSTNSTLEVIEAIKRQEELFSLFTLGFALIIGIIIFTMVFNTFRGGFY